MSAEFWAILGVGVAMAGLQWRMYASLNGRLDRIEGRMDRLEGRMDRIEGRMDRMQEDLASVKERLSRIEGWIAGRFREETAPA